MTIFSAFHQAGDIGLLVLRIAIGVIFWMHGRFKKGIWKMQPSEQLPAPLLSVLKILSLAEPLGAIAIVLGALTQVTAICFCVVMLGAIPARRKQGAKFLDPATTGWELEFLILGSSIALALLGGGQYSIDHMIFSGR